MPEDIALPTAEAVDLGLSVKWASCNFGSGSPEDYGGYYYWNNTKNKIVYNWGDSWRLPTVEEIEELSNSCTWEWIKVNGVYGQKVTGPNGNSIFLPASGLYSTKNGGFDWYYKYRRSDGWYWIDLKRSNIVNRSEGCYFNFDESGFDGVSVDDSYGGNSYRLPVRLVFCPESNISEDAAVDLGLSVKWASRNVGAESPANYGDRYAWGEIEEKDNYELSTYLYYERDLYKNGSYLFIGNNIGGTEYDVAHVKLGDGWRMPTKDEFTELCKKCTWKSIIYRGVKGYKISGNGNSIFLPADDGDRYWSATLDGRSSAYSLKDTELTTSDRYNGYRIRPVRIR